MRRPHRAENRATGATRITADARRISDKGAAGGSKTIERVGTIMRALEQGPEDGMSAAHIATETRIDRATAYRALVSLTRIGLVDRDAQSHKFRLGVYLFSLAAITARRFTVLSHARDVVARIARETGDTVFLSVRNRQDSVCIDCMTGSYPIKAQTLSVGDSVPLGVSAGGIAMLATMSDDEVRHSLQYNAVAIGKFRTIRPEQIYDHVQQARKQGYARYSGQVIAGMGGVARAIRDARGNGVAVISVTALLDRMGDDRVRQIARLLDDGVRDVERRAWLRAGV